MKKIIEQFPDFTKFASQATQEFRNILIEAKKGTKEYRKIVKLLKDSASKLKMEWLYINRIIYAVIAFVISKLAVSKLAVCICYFIFYLFSDLLTQHN